MAARADPRPLPKSGRPARSGHPFSAQSFSRVPSPHCRRTEPSNAYREDFGKAIVLPGMQAAEQAGVPAFLENSDELNLRFYRRLGSEMTAEVAIPDSGPTTWCMLRRTGT